MGNSQPDDPLPEDLEGYAVIGSYASERAAHEAGLAVLACGHDYWIQVIEGRFVLVVIAAFAGKLRREVAISAFKNRFWPPRPLSLPVASIRKEPTFAAIVYLIGCYYLQTRHPEAVELGANVGIGDMAGQWWRLATAVTLHADIGHLVGNLIGLGFFGYLCGRYFGSGISWLIILGVALLSNLASSLVHAGEAYRSIGSSTAVFAALGLLSGYPLGAFLRNRQPAPLRDWLLPLTAGGVLLAWLGGGTFPTDFGAHLWSWIFGFAVAVAGARLKPFGNVGFGTLAALLPIAAWGWAILASG